MPNVFIAIGSNIGDSKNTAINAIRQISSLVGTKLVKKSPFYRSKPLGPQDQPDYLNAVIEIKTALSPLQLLDELQKIELNLGRVRKDIRWSARTIDLDILLYDDLVMQTERLTLPHYDMFNREFVLYPLQNIAPDLVFPNNQTFSDVLKQINKNELTLWD